MPAISGKQIGIDRRRATKCGRFYEIVKGDPYVSITNVLNIVNKPALVPWAAKMERQAVMSVAADMFEELNKPLVISTGRSRDTYLSLLESRIGRAKAATKEMEAAGEIGTQAHAMIEWHLAGLLGQRTGPPPKICTAASWAYLLRARAHPRFRRAARGFLQEAAPPLVG